MYIIKDKLNLPEAAFSWIVFYKKFNRKQLRLYTCIYSLHFCRINLQGDIYIPVYICNVFINEICDLTLYTS